MNSIAKFVCLALIVAVANTRTSADPLSDFDAPDRSGNTFLALGSPGVGSGEHVPLTVTVVGTNLDFTDFFRMEEPGHFIGTLVFFDAGAPATASDSRIVPEPSTWILLLLAIGLLLAMRRTVPINFRTVHSRLRAQRGHAPIR